MNYEQITVEHRQNVAIVTLNRPAKMNAWTYRMHDELITAIEAINDDADIGAIVLTANGRGFCAGADFVENSKKDEHGERPRAKRRESWSAFIRQSKPVVAAINGVALGIGSTLTLPCDIIFASDKAKIGLIFVKMGLVPELGSSHLLVQRVGLAKASEMCLTGRSYQGEELLRMGLVDYLVAADELLDRAFDLASEIAANPAPQLRMTKELLSVNGSCSDLELVEKREREMLKLALATPEHREAVNAFLSRSKS
ncbi:MAG: enoyl-CoA hydratase/isomerase family protein [Proteobacteria bacterium]|nr:enoyl-CoA hydratase/isomerase family protein [Pseudomonadota bacterium]